MSRSFPASRFPLVLISPGRSLGLISVLLWLAAPAASHAQSVVWDRQALGQLQGECTPGDTNTDWYWPNDNNWSQAEQTGPACNNPGNVELQPSNWTTPGYPNGPDADVVIGDMGAVGTLADVNVSIGSLTILPTGALTIGSINFQCLNFDFQGDGTLGQAGNDVVTLLSGGLMKKSGGAGSFVIVPPVLITNGTVEVDSGELVLSASRDFTCDNATFNVATNALLDLTGGSAASWEGEMTGSGAGQVVMASGSIISPGLVFNFPTNYFWWTGGSLGSEGQGQSFFTNTGGITVSATNTPNLSAGYLYNDGLILETNAGVIIDGYVQNNASGTMQFAGDGGLDSTLTFVNYGLVRKSSGTGNSIIANFQNQGGTIEADGGVLTLGGANANDNGTFNAGADAVVDLTGGGQPIWAGTMTGSGPGQVLLADGTIQAAPTGLTLNFPPGLFWWTGGNLYNNTVTNLNSITIYATNSPALAYCGLYNQGMILQTNAGTFSVGAFVLVNQPSATYEFDGDGGTSGNIFYNQGLLRKRTGTGTSVMICALANYGGTIEADSGTLALANGGTSSNATLVAGAAGVIDLTGGENGSTWSGTLTGSGAGRVLLGSGVINIPSSGSLTLDFPPGLFWWTGGSLYNGSVINSNSITISSVNSPTLLYGVMYNYGLIQHTNSGNFSIGAFSLVNEPGGAYEFDGDGGSVSGNQYNNDGLLRKRSGTGTSTMTCTLNNQGGTIEVDSGMLAVPGGLAINSGAVTIVLGGSGAGQCGQLLVNGSVTLSGALTVTLANGFVPTPGTQFQIIASSGLSGSFSSLLVPAGCSISYQNSGVYLVVNLLPVMIQPPQLSNGGFAFAFQTLSNQSYTVQQATNLALPDWIFYTNFTGNGAVMSVPAPTTNLLQQFFRVTEP